MALLEVLCIAVLLVVATLVAWAVLAALAAALSKNRARAAVLALPLAVGTVATLAAAGGACLWFVANNPPTVFERQFGFEPPPGTRVIDGRSFAFGDSSTAFLHFRTSRATLARIVDGYALDPTPGETDGDPPRWYRPDSAAGVQRFVRDGGGSFSHERRRVAYNPATGEAWYSFVGID